MLFEKKLVFGPSSMLTSGLPLPVVEASFGCGGLGVQILAA